MVVHDVEQHHEPVCVRRVDQTLQVFGRPVTVRGREREYAVVAPIASAGEFRHRHEFDGRDAEIGEIGEAPRSGGEGPFRRKCANVQLVEHGFVPGAAAPLFLLPNERQRIHDRARGVDAFRIESRRRVGERVALVAVERIARSRSDAR